MKKYRNLIYYGFIGLIIITLVFSYKFFRTEFLEFFRNSKGSVEYGLRYLNDSNKDHIGCNDFNVERVSHRLTDKMRTYQKQAKRDGIEASASRKELEDNDRMVRVEESEYFKIDALTHSYAFLTKEAYNLLLDIGANFHSELEGTGLEGSKFIVTSLTRTKEQVEKLRRNNSNASKNSAHMYGECFDITYKRFSNTGVALDECHIDYLKETLAGVIRDMKSNRKCWAVTEKNQPCFHVVYRH